MKKKKAVLQLGSNMGNSKVQFVIAQQHIIKQIGDIKYASSLYRSCAWGLEMQPDFLNQVIEVETLLNDVKLLNAVQDIEVKMGRVKNILYGPRIIDIDILFYNDSIINKRRLSIPHPLLQHRRFVLEPLVELYPDFVHPILEKTITELLAECTDTLNVQKI